MQITAPNAQRVYVARLSSRATKGWPAPKAMMPPHRKQPSSVPWQIEKYKSNLSASLRKSKVQKCPAMAGPATSRAPSRQATCLFFTCAAGVMMTPVPYCPLWWWRGGHYTSSNCLERSVAGSARCDQRSYAPQTVLVSLLMRRSSNHGLV